MKKEIDKCWVCGRKKTPYMVFLKSDNYIGLINYNLARGKGEICKSCWDYYCLTSVFKKANSEDFKLAKEAKNFAVTMLKWWEKDKKLNLNETNSRDWEGTDSIARWYRGNKHKFEDKLIKV